MNLYESITKDLYEAEFKIGDKVRIKTADGILVLYVLFVILVKIDLGILYMLLLRMMDPIMGYLLGSLQNLYL